MFHGIHAVRRKLRDPNWIEYQLMRCKSTNPNLSWVIIYKKAQRTNIFHIRPKNGE